ncbi:MFS transporter [Kocuria sp.]|uniref:MFS transporter n=1 Tax=Kocuria sp. TaxID=1871328 RepID=UPI0026E00551|nr:aromatic acid/H+ symport family MFS transporter [Kocuria sp.]MDO5618814.1 aromatic acid/H+ symport family MFS transporter [Kocuria sp.]
MVILKGRGWVAPLCWVAVLLDGFDAVVLGAVMSSMIDDPEFALTAASGTTVATVGLVGMMIGALGMGWATDKFGRRKLLIGAVILFSIFTFGMAFVDSIFLFGLLRFLAGVGLGGCLPTGISMVTEFAGRGRTGKSTTLMMTGYHVGAVLTAALAIVVVQNINWHAMFIIGALPALVLVPLMYFYLPESPDYLLSKGRVEDARRVSEHYGLDFSHQEQVERELRAAAVAGTVDGTGPGSTAQADAPAKAEPRGAATVLSGQYQRNTVLVWITSFMGLLLVYGLNTWLPQIMRSAGYDLGNALGFLLILNIGAVVGLVIAGRVADRVTPRVAAVVWFIGAGALLAALAIKLPLLGIYAMVFVTGCFVFSAQVLVYAFCAANYPTKVRATALGMAAGIGRLGAISGPILGGAVLAAGVAHPWGFFGFAIAAILGGGAMAGTKTLQQGD